MFPCVYSVALFHSVSVSPFHAKSHFLFLVSLPRAVFIFLLYSHFSTMSNCHFLLSHHEQFSFFIITHLYHEQSLCTSLFCHLFYKLTFLYHEHHYLFTFLSSFPQAYILYHYFTFFVVFSTSSLSLPLLHFFCRLFHKCTFLYHEQYHTSLLNSHYFTFFVVFSTCWPASYPSKQLFSKYAFISVQPLLPKLEQFHTSSITLSFNILYEVQRVYMHLTR